MALFEKCARTTPLSIIHTQPSASSRPESIFSEQPQKPLRKNLPPYLDYATVCMFSLLFSILFCFLGATNIYLYLLHFFIDKNNLITCPIGAYHIQTQTEVDTLRKEIESILIKIFSTSSTIENLKNNNEESY